MRNRSIVSSLPSLTITVLFWYLPLRRFRLNLGERLSVTHRVRRIAHARYGNTSFGPRDSCAPPVQRNHQPDAVRCGMKGVGTQLMVVTGVVITGKREVSWKLLIPPVPRWRQDIHPKRKHAIQPPGCCGCFSPVLLFIGTLLFVFPRRVL